jgi:hypothetical protein
MVAILDEVACRICGVEYDKCEMSLTYLESIKDCFGVFVSVKKDGAVYSCMGSWTNTILDKDRLYYLIMNLCQSIRDGEDPRSLGRLDKPFTVKLYFMQMPLIQVVPDDYFDNEKYGLIVCYGDKRATFLPNVFGNVLWDVISKCLLNKAGIDEKKNVMYSAYTAECIHKDYIVV